MTYEAIDRLTYDVLFQARVRSCTVEQAELFRSDDREPFRQLANDVLRGGGSTTLTFCRIAGAAPGLADKATADGTFEVDHTLVTDEDILAVVQAEWEVVAGLYYGAEAAP